MLVVLAYYGDRLVGLLASFVIDDGRTSFLRAARIGTEFQGKGFFRQLREFARTYTMRHFTSLRREMLMTSDKVHAQGDIERLECCVLSYHVCQQESQAKISMIKLNSVEMSACSREYFYNFILSPPVRGKLSPNNIIVVNSRAFEPIRSNVDHMFQECSKVFVDKGADNAIPRSISFGTFSKREKFIHWRVSAYAEDPALFKAHLLCQVKLACEVISGDFIFVSWQVRSLTHLAKEVMEKELQLKECDTSPHETWILYERKHGSPDL